MVLDLIGLAKTGTTAVAMTLRNTLQIEGFCMEPLDLAKIEEETDERLVIKISFDHWIRARRYVKGLYKQHKKREA